MYFQPKGIIVTSALPQPPLQGNSFIALSSLTALMHWGISSISLCTNSVTAVAFPLQTSEAAMLTLEAEEDLLGGWQIQLLTNLLV